MTLPQRAERFDRADFLAWEAVQPERHEYLDGEVFAMGGASDAHGTVALNLGAALHQHLRGTPCRPFIADMKVDVAAANACFYPDVLVTCDERDRNPEASHRKRHPCLIVEVLSPSTEAFDRGEKFAAYRRLPALSEYVLIAIEARRIEVFRRDADGHWVLYPYDETETLVLESINLQLPAHEVFEGLA